MWKVYTNDPLRLVKFTLCSFSGSSSNSPLPSRTPWMIPVFPNITELSFQYQLKKHKLFTKHLQRHSISWPNECRHTTHSNRKQTPSYALVFSESYILFSTDDSWTTRFCRTTAVMCHQNVPGKRRVFHLFQELTRPNANKNIHFTDSISALDCHCLLLLLLLLARFYVWFLNFILEIEICVGTFFF